LKLTILGLLNAGTGREFEAKASGVLGELYEKDTMTARELLERPLKSWGQRKLLDVANAAQQMDFMKHECCQTKINKS